MESGASPVPSYVCIIGGTVPAHAYRRYRMKPPAAPPSEPESDPLAAEVARSAEDRRRRHEATGRALSRRAGQAAVVRAATAHLRRP